MVVVVVVCTQCGQCGPGTLGANTQKRVDDEEGGGGRYTYASEKCPAAGVLRGGDCSRPHGDLPLIQPQVLGQEVRQRGGQQRHAEA